MAINFPDSPSVNDTHTVGDSTWTWDGTKWTIDPAAAGGGAVSSVNTQTGAVVLDADDIDDTSTAHKFATATQLSNADSAVQPGDLATVATSGSYNDLSNQPTTPWTAVAGGINYSGGEVGIAQASPATTLDIDGAYCSNAEAMGGGTAINCSLGNYFTKTVSGAVTFSFSNVPASRAYSLTMEIDYTSGSITWPASVNWPGGTAPTLATGNTQIIVLATSDGGTTWRGNALADFAN